MKKAVGPLHREHKMMVANMMSKTLRDLNWILVLFLPIAGPILRPDDHRILRYYAAIMRIVRPIMHQVFLILRPNDGRTIKELLFAMDGYSQTKYKKQFDESEKSKLDNNEPSEAFDISLLYKLLQSVCGLASSNDAKWNESGTIENYLKQMKNSRNILAHEEISFTQTELEAKMNSLEKLCRGVLVACGLRGRRQVTAEVVEMENNMEQVLLGGIDLWEPYKEALRDLRNKQAAVLVQMGHRDIKSLGKKLRILNPFSWLLDDNYAHLDVQHTFTKLAIQGEKDIDMYKLLTTTLPSGELPDIIVITGGPGMGKSSLTRFLVQDWLSFNPIMLGLENVDLLLPVELRHVTSNNLKDMMKEEVIPSVFQDLHTDDVITTLNSISVVWILDGYDEATLATKKLVKELLRKSPNSRVIITTRTEFKSEVESTVSHIHRKHVSVSIRGFSQDDIEICAKKLIEVSKIGISERSDMLNRFMEFCKERNSFMEEIFTVPLFLTITVIMWLEDPNHLSKIKTMTALYNALVDHIINKLLARESFSTLSERNPTLVIKINRFLDELGFILSKNEIEFTLQEYEVTRLVSKCKTLGIPFKDTMSAFFVYNEKASTEGITEEYTIIHRTMKDFLSARAFCNHLTSRKWDVVTAAMDWIKTSKDKLQYDNRNINLLNRYNLDNLEMEKPKYDLIANSWRILEFNCINLIRFQQQVCTICHSNHPIDPNYELLFYENRGIPRARSYSYHIRQSLGALFSLYCIGYLCIKNEMNLERAEEFLFLSGVWLWDRFTSQSHALHLFREGNKSIFSTMFTQYVQNSLWSFSFYEEPDGLDHAKQSLKYAVPKNVHIHYCKAKMFNPLNLIDNCIQTFKMHKLNIHLDLRDLHFHPAKDLHRINNCFRELLANTTEARLITLRSPVDDVSIQLLDKAIHLEEVSVTVLRSNLLMFAEVLKKLSKLKNLCIFIDPASNYEQELPTLNMGHENLSNFILILQDIYTVNPQMVRETLGKISHFVRYVVLTGPADVTAQHVHEYVQKIATSLSNIKVIDLIFHWEEHQQLIHYVNELKPQLVSLLYNRYPNVYLRIDIMPKPDNLEVKL